MIGQFVVVNKSTDNAVSGDAFTSCQTRMTQKFRHPYCGKKTNQ